jgi:xylan 1,4-beta-xylosidase
MARSYLFSTVLFLGIVNGLFCSPCKAQNSPQTIAIDAHAPSRPFPHFWEQTFGSGRAILTLRESYRNDLREVLR